MGYTKEQQTRLCSVCGDTYRDPDGRVSQIHRHIPDHPARYSTPRGILGHHRFVPTVRVYVASSWRNEVQPEVVRLLREAAFDVYDFKDPSNDKGAFRWSDLGIERPEDWTPQQCIEFLAHPIAEEGFRQDFNAMQWADACVLVLPAGRSANLESGWFVGQGKPLVVIKDHGVPDLMYKMATRVVTGPAEAVSALKGVG